MKKLIALLMAMLMLVSLCSCGKDKDNQLGEQPGIIPDSTVEVEKDGEGIQADLDGDGADETIKVEVVNDELGYESGWKLVVESSDSSTSTSFQNDGFLAKANVIDLDSFDNLQEIVVTYDYASDNYATYIFRYVDGALTHTPEIWGKYTAISDGIITVYYNVEVLGSTWNAYTTYKLGNDFSLVRNDNMWYIESTEDDYLTTNTDIAITTEDDIVTTLPAGTRIVPVSSDLESIINIRTEDGTYGTISFSISSGGQSVIGGQDVDEIIDDTQYAG